MDPSDDIRKLEGHLELIENILAHTGADDADGAQMISEQFQSCNELRPNLETAAEIVLDQDDGAALFSQITNVLERLENMEREWKTRKTRPRVSEASAPPPPPTLSTGTQGSAAAAAVAFPAASPVSSDQRSEKSKALPDGTAGSATSAAFPAFPSAGAWPETGSAGGFQGAAFDSGWGVASGSAGGWGDAAPAWPEANSQLGAFPATGFEAAETSWPAEEAPAASPAVASPSPAPSPALRDLPPLGSVGSNASSASTSFQLHIKCSTSDMEEVQRDQDRFKQRFVRAAAKAAGVPEYRIKVKSITNV